MLPPHKKRPDQLVWVEPSVRFNALRVAQGWGRLPHNWGTSRGRIPGNRSTSNAQTCCRSSCSSQSLCNPDIPRPLSLCTYRTLSLPPCPAPTLLLQFQFQRMPPLCTSAPGLVRPAPSARERSPSPSARTLSSRIQRAATASSCRNSVRKNAHNGILQQPVLSLEYDQFSNTSHTHIHHNTGKGEPRQSSAQFPSLTHSLELASSSVILFLQSSVWICIYYSSTSI